LSDEGDEEETKRMLNFVPKSCPSVSLLYGKRGVQRITAGSAQRHIEIPLAVTNEVVESVDKSQEYLSISL